MDPHTDESRNNTYEGSMPGVKVKLSHMFERINLFISTSAGQDAVLSSIEYLSYTLYHSMVYAQARQNSRKGLNRPLKIPALSNISALASLISETRHALRLLGLVRIFSRGLDLSQNASNDPGGYVLAILQKYLLASYQVTENIAFLVVRGVLSKRRVERYGRLESLYLWSARFLLGGVIAQIIRLFCQSLIYKMENRGSDSQEIKRAAETKKEALRDEHHDCEKQLENRQWWQSLTTSLLWTPLCLHWSVSGGIGIPNPLVGPLCLSATAWGIHDAWRNTDIC